MRYLCIILSLIVISCIPEPERDNRSKGYYLKAYLFAGDSVKQIQVKRVKKYTAVVADSENIIIPTETWVTDAKVTLFHENTPIPLTFDTYGKRNYTSSHIVQEGANYRIRVELYDTINQLPIELTASTICPRKDRSISLDRDTMYIDQDQIENEFWEMYRYPEQYPHFTVNISPSEQYQMLIFSGSGSAILSTWMPTYVKRIPQKATKMIISPIHFQSYRFYPQYRLVVHHLNKEYADLYAHNGPESEAWLQGNTDLVPEGISNVSNGGGIFTAIASDTLKFFLKAKL